MTSLRKFLLQKLVRRRPTQALLLAARELGITTIRYELPEGSPLRREPDATSLELVLDDVMAPPVLATGTWEAGGLEFLQGHAPKAACLFLDVGANIGLITRQCLHTMPQVTHALCFEPHPVNFGALSFNLAHLPQCRLVQAALGPEAGILELFADLGNMGNNSLNRAAMGDRPYRSWRVPCLRTADALALHVPAEAGALPILWKSDTQGLDELIVNSVPADLWARVEAGAMELWKVAKPPVDLDVFAHRLAPFKVLRFGRDPARNLTVAEVIGFLRSEGPLEADLYFAR